MTLREALNQGKMPISTFLYIKRNSSFFETKGSQRTKAPCCMFPGGSPAKSRCVESLPVYIWPSQICSRGWRMCWLEAEGPFWVLTEKQRSGLHSWFLTAKTMVESLMAKAAPLPLSLLDNGDRLFGNPELLRESQHCSTLVHVFCERKFFLARQIWYTEPTSQTNFLLVLKKSLQC